MYRFLFRALCLSLFTICINLAASAQASPSTTNLDKLVQTVGRDCLDMEEIPGLVEKGGMPSFCKCVTGRASAAAQNTDFRDQDLNSTGKAQKRQQLESVAISYCMQEPMIASAAKETADQCNAGNAAFQLPSSLPAAARHQQCDCIAGYVARSAKIESTSDEVPINLLKQKLSAARGVGVASCKTR